MFARLGIFCSLILIWCSFVGFPREIKALIVPLLAASFAYRFGVSEKKNNFKLLAISYFFWLIKEIVISSIAVTKIIWKKNIIMPVLEPIKTIQTNQVGVVLYANSITLTPGTVTLSAEGDMLLVHALDIEFMEGLKDGKMDAKIKEIIK